MTSTPPDTASLKAMFEELKDILPAFITRKSCKGGTIRRPRGPARRSKIKAKKL